MTSIFTFRATEGFAFPGIGNLTDVSKPIKPFNFPERHRLLLSIPVRDVFRVREFGALWASYVLSFGGDRLALVALTILVYDRTRSPLLAAVAYAAGTVPYFLGALFLSGLADRLPRRGVMVTCDVLRAGLVAVMLVPRMPLDALIGLLYAVTAVQPVFDSARSAVIRDVLPGEQYPLGATVMQMTGRTMASGERRSAG